MRSHLQSPGCAKFLAAFLLLVTVTAVAAVPYRYGMDTSGSRVQFSWIFGQDRFTGQMPVVQADLVIDFATLQQSRVNVSVDASRADAGFPFATDAMRGPRVLDTRRYPMITFTSSSVTETGPGKATIEGDLTIRGVTRRTRLNAAIYRQSGTAAEDLTSLTVLLTGAVARSAFGANGWSEFVGDRVGLDIRVRIHRQD